MLILKGYDSVDNSYLVNDYPYGFRFRCKIRYWLEYSEKLGYRFCSQTSNPKRTIGDGRHKVYFWNKPKKSTYILVVAFMYLAEDNHVAWSVLTEYSDLQTATEFKEKFYEGLSDTGKQRLDNWIRAKTIYEEKIIRGTTWQQAEVETVKETNVIC